MEKNKLSEGLMIKLLSVALAITLWMYVQGQQPQSIHEGIQTFKEVEIQWSTDSGYVVTAATSKTAEITVAGSMDAINLISKEDIIIDLDLTNLSKGRHTVAIKPKIPAGIRIFNTIPAEVDLVLDSWIERTMDVELEFVNKLPENALIMEQIIEPKQVVISGAEAIIDDVDRVVAEYDYTIMGQQEPDVILKAKNNAGVTLTAVNITEFVNLTVVIEYTKNVPVRLNDQIEVPTGVIVKLQPANVTAVGPKELMNELVYIETGYFDIEGMVGESFEVALIYPEGIKPLNEQYEKTGVIIN